MGKSIFKRAGSVFISTIMTLAMVCVSPVSRTNAAQNNWLFDLGGTAQNGYTSVSASEEYSSSKGYGFRNTAGVKNVSASGSGALSDAVQFTDTENTSNTFDVDLQKGLYRVTVILGDTNRTSVYMENMLQIVNMTGNNAKDSILIPVTDGQLNIRAAAGKTGYPFSISSIQIEYISSDTVLPPTIWMCGDSTVCNYYPLDSSVQAGWGQVLNQFIDDKKWQVRNMAASGQYAKGFMDAGQFDAPETYGKAGDKYIISIGINDTNYSNEEEYYATVTDMAKRAMAKGMEVILVKQQGRSTDISRNPPLTGRWFGGTLDKIGSELDLQVIDLFNLFSDYCKSIGQEATTNLYMPDDQLHPNRQGALKLAELAAGQIRWSEVPEGEEIAENTLYMLKNVNSGLYITAEKEENFANVSQGTADMLNKNHLWSVKKATDGYYRIYSFLDGGNRYLLDLAYGKADNGTNIGIYENTDSDAQLFKFLKNNDGSYCITTKNSNDQSCVEVKNADTATGGNIQEWEINGNSCQSWLLEPVTYSEAKNIVLGDLNDDGFVNIFDSIILKRGLISKNFNRDQVRKSDSNSDGISDISDFKAMTKFLFGTDNFEAVNNKTAYYFAADASFSQGTIENVNAGFLNDKYVNLDNKKDSFIEWNITAPETGNYLCSFRVANGSAENRPMKITVNGNSDCWMQDFLTTNAWTEWNVRGIVLPLNAGKNVIRMISETPLGGPNIDGLRIEKTEEPIAEIYVPEIKPDPIENDKPTIYIAGDSTVQTYRASYAPQQGWGAYLANYLEDGVTVSNHAIAGRSSKSFYDNGRLDTILNNMKKGDYLLIQFGINDSASNNAERYAPVSGSVPGSDGSFEYYISKYIEGTLEKGGTPVLITTVLGLKAYNKSTGKFDGSYQNYCNAMKQLAAYYKIPCIDLNTLMKDHYNSIGYDKAYTYHLISTELSETDMTHFTETGASAVAELVANALAGQTDIKIK